jgi:hypothetical protein
MNVVSKDKITTEEGHAIAKEFSLSNLRPKEFCSKKYSVPYFKIWV